MGNNLLVGVKLRALFCFLCKFNRFGDSSVRIRNPVNGYSRALADLAVKLWRHLVVIAECNAYSVESVTHGTFAHGERVCGAVRGDRHVVGICHSDVHTVLEYGVERIGYKLTVRKRYVKLLQKILHSTCKYGVYRIAFNIGEADCCRAVNPQSAVLACREAGGIELISVVKLNARLRHYGLGVALRREDSRYFVAVIYVNIKRRRGCKSGYGAHNRERYYKCRDLCKSLAAHFYIALNFCYHHSAPLTHTCRSLKFGNAAAGRL